MYKLPIEDKYFEITLSDGTVAYTRTRFVVEALMYYRKQCIDFINKVEPGLRGAPRLITVNSYEEIFKKINDVQNNAEKLSRVKKLLEQIDETLKKITDSQKTSQPETGLQNTSI